MNQQKFEEHIERFLEKKNHDWGGRRTASEGKKIGRPKNEPTVRIRIPESQAEHIKRYVQHLQGGGQPFDEMELRLTEAEFLMWIIEADTPEKKIETWEMLARFSRWNNFQLSERAERYKPDGCE